jgi:hypothetical protein
LDVLGEIFDSKAVSELAGEPAQELNSGDELDTLLATLRSRLKPGKQDAPVATSEVSTDRELVTAGKEAART